MDKLDHQQMFNLLLVELRQLYLTIETLGSHPLEKMLTRWLRQQRVTTQQVIIEALNRLKNEDRSAIADFITILGRLNFRLVKKISKSIIRIGLEHSDTEVRDNTIGVIENWEHPDLLKILKEHVEKEPVLWIRRYAEGVLQDYNMGS